MPLCDQLQHSDVPAGACGLPRFLPFPTKHLKVQYRVKVAAGGVHDDVGVPIEWTMQPRGKYDLRVCRWSRSGFAAVLEVSSELFRVGRKLQSMPGGCF